MGGVGSNPGPCRLRERFTSNHGPGTTSIHQSPAVPIGRAEPPAAARGRFRGRLVGIIRFQRSIRGDRGCSTALAILNANGKGRNFLPAEPDNSEIFAGSDRIGDAFFSWMGTALPAAFMEIGVLRRGWIRLGRERRVMGFRPPPAPMTRRARGISAHRKSDEFRPRNRWNGWIRGFRQPSLSRLRISTRCRRGRHDGLSPSPGAGPRARPGERGPKDRFGDSPSSRAPPNESRGRFVHRSARVPTLWAQGSIRRFAPLSSSSPNAKRGRIHKPFPRASGRSVSEGSIPRSAPLARLRRTQGADRSFNPLPRGIRRSGFQGAFRRFLPPSAARPNASRGRARPPLPRASRPIPIIPSTRNDRSDTDGGRGAPTARFRT